MKRVFAYAIALVALAAASWFGVRALGGGHTLASVAIPFTAAEDLPDTPDEWHGRIDYRVLDRQLGKRRRDAAAELCGFGSEREIETRRELHRPQHPQRILDEGSARMPQHAGLQIALASVRIDQCSAKRIQRDRVHGEVAAGRGVGVV